MQTQDDMMGAIFQAQGEAMLKQTQELIAAVKKGNLKAVKNIINVISSSPLIGIGPGLMNIPEDIAALVLLHAIAAGHQNIIETIKEAGAKLSAATKQQYYEILIEIATTGDLKGLKNLIKVLPSMLKTISKKDLEMALLYTTSGGHQNIAEVLLEAGASIKVTDDLEQSLLQLVVSYGHLNFVEFLLPKSNVNHRDKRKFTALMMAAQTGRDDIATVIIKAGADINLKDERDSTALMIASRFGNHNIVKVLLADSRTDINHQDNITKSSALIIAMQAQQYGMATSLIKAKADVNLVNKINDSSLWIAISQNKNEELIKLLITLSSPDIIQYSENRRLGATNLDTAWFTTSLLNSACLAGNLSIVKLLHKKSADIHKGALRSSTEDGYIDIARYLLEQGCNINSNSDNEMERTALHTAILNKQDDMVYFLISKGADVNACAKNGLTPLMEAVMRGTLKSVKLLLENGANVKAQITSNKMTALHFAVACEGGKPNLELIKLLLKHNANPLAESVYNGLIFTPISTASLNNMLDVLKLLLEQTVVIAKRYKNEKEKQILTSAISEAWLPACETDRVDILKFLYSTAPYAEECREKSKYLLATSIKTGKVQAIRLALEMKIITNLNEIFLEEDASYIRNENHAFSTYPEGFTSLHYTVQKGDIELTQFLLNNGANIHATCLVQFGNSKPISVTGLMLAKTQEEDQMVHFLVNRLITTHLKSFMLKHIKEMKRIQELTVSISEMLCNLQINFDAKNNFHIHLNSFADKEILPKRTHRSDTVCFTPTIIADTIQKIFLSQHKEKTFQLDDFEKNLWDAFCQTPDEEEIMENAENKLKHEVKNMMENLETDNRRWILSSINQEVLSKIERQLQDPEIKDLLSKSNQFLESMLYIDSVENNQNIREKDKNNKLQLEINNLRTRNKESFQTIEELQEEFEEARTHITLKIRVFVEKGEGEEALLAWKNLQSDDALNKMVQDIKKQWDNILGIKDRLTEIKVTLQKQREEEIKKEAALEKADRKKKLDLKIEDKFETAAYKQKLRDQEDAEKKEKLAAAALREREITLRRRREERKKQVEERLREAQSKTVEETADTLSLTTTSRDKSTFKPYYLLSRQKPRRLTLNMKGAVSQHTMFFEETSLLGTVLSKIEARDPGVKSEFGIIWKERNALLGIFARALENIKDLKSDYAPFSPVLAEHFRDVIFHAFDLCPPLKSTRKTHLDFSASVKTLVSLILKYIKEDQSESKTQQELYQQLIVLPLFKRIKDYRINNTPTLEDCLAHRKHCITEENQYISEDNDNIVMGHAKGFTAGCKGVIAAVIRDQYNSEFRTHLNQYAKEIREGKSYRHVKSSSQEVVLHFTYGSANKTAYSQAGSAAQAPGDGKSSQSKLESKKS